jgi:VIT1/CCC1 family predicted Fe2+/Mn2+ transporter
MVILREASEGGYTLRFLDVFLRILTVILMYVGAAYLLIVTICWFVSHLLAGSASIGMALLSIFVLFFIVGVITYNEVYYK